MKKPTKQAPLNPEPSLLPENIEQPEMVFVELTSLPPDSELHSDPPDSVMVSTVKGYGVFHPILLIAGEPLKVAAGRRRIKAARQCEHERIPARIFPAGWTPQQVITLIENAQRRPNYAADVRSILTLLGHDLDELLKLPITFGQEEVTTRQLLDVVLDQDKEATISLAVGMDRQTIRHRWGFLNLTPDLMRLFLTGEIRASTAEALTRLPAHRQREAKAILDDSGKLTQKDISKIKQVGSVSAIAGMSSALFAAPEKELMAQESTVEIKVNWRDASAARLNEVLALVPAGQREIRRSLRETLSLVDKNKSS